MFEKLENIYYNITLFFSKIHLVRYDLSIFEDENNWWSDDLQRWVSLNIRGNKSSSRTFRSKREAFKEFDILTENGIRCRLNDRKIKLWKGWYFCKEWYSEKQDYFNCKNKEEKK